jgi:hypothetical protein
MKSRPAYLRQSLCGCRRKRLTNTKLHVNGQHFAKIFIFAASYCMYGRRAASGAAGKNFSCERSQGVIMRLGLVIGFALTIILVLIVSRNFNPYLIFLVLLPVFYLAGMYRSFTSSARKTKRDARSLEKTFLKELLRDAAVIDSTVWQNENYGSLFEALSILLAATGKKFILYDCQLQELTNAADRTEAREELQKKIAHAKVLIERFRAQDIIALEPAGISATAEEMLEPPAVQALICATRTSRNVTLLSDSREHITLARKAMKERKTGLTIIDNLEDLEAACSKYCAAVGEKKIFPAAGKRR